MGEDVFSDGEDVEITETDLTADADVADETILEEEAVTEE